MDPAAVLALIGDLYAQVRQLQTERDQALAQLAAAQQGAGDVPR